MKYKTLTSKCVLKMFLGGSTIAYASGQYCIFCPVVWECDRPGSNENLFLNLHDFSN